MIRVTFDRETLGKLQDFDDVVEVCDETGRIVGYLSPANGSIPPGVVEPVYSEADLERLLAPEGGRPLADILADL